MKELIVKVSCTPQKIITTYYIERYTSLTCSPSGKIVKK